MHTHYSRTLQRQLRPALVALLVFTVACGVAYPLAVTGVSQLFFRDRANGSLVRVDGEVVGSSLVGQTFTGPGYFRSRPSAAGDGYDAAASSGSNLGPNSRTLLTGVVERVAAYRSENGLGAEFAVPVDAVTASASGLDPHISIANARLQARRIADERALLVEAVMAVIADATFEPPLGMLGDGGVNVLHANRALDELTGR